MLKRLKNNFGLICIIVFIAIIVVPTLVYWLSTYPLLYGGENNDWASFWGGYLGAIISCGITTVVFYLTIKHSDQDREDDRRADLSQHIIKLVVDYTSQILSVIKISYEYSEESTINNRSEFIQKINIASKMLSELSVFIVVHEKKYPDLNKITQECDGLQKVSQLLIEYVNNVKNPDKEIFEKLSRMIYDGITEVNTTLAEVLLTIT